MGRKKRSQANQGDDDNQIEENTKDNSGLKTVMAEPTYKDSPIKTLQQENQRLKKDVHILKEVLASVVSKGNALFKPEDLTVDVNEDAVLIHGEVENGNDGEGFTYQQFKWRYPISNKVNFKEKTEEATFKTQEMIPNSKENSKDFKRGLQANLTTHKTDQNENSHHPKRDILVTSNSPTQEEVDRTPSFIYDICINHVATGEKTRLLVRSTDTIAVVKAKIGEKLGFFPKNQVLQLYGSEVLEDGKTVANYYIRNNTDIALTIKTIDSMTISVKCMDGHILYLEARPTTTVEHFKAMVFHMSGVPSDQQRLVFKGKQLEDNPTLSYYQIQEGSKIHLVLKLRGD